MAIELTGLPASNNMTTGGNGQIASSQENANKTQRQGQAAAVIVDNVTLTREAKQLSMIEAGLRTQPEIDLERVADLKNRIDSGQYTINPERVAEKFLQLEAQLIG